MKNYSIALAFFGFIAISFMTGVSAQAGASKERYQCGRIPEVARDGKTAFRAPTTLTYSQIANAKLRLGAPAKAKVVQ